MRYLAEESYCKSIPHMEVNKVQWYFNMYHKKPSKPLAISRDEFLRWMPGKKERSFYKIMFQIEINYAAFI